MNKIQVNKIANALCYLLFLISGLSACIAITFTDYGTNSHLFLKYGFYITALLSLISYIVTKLTTVKKNKTSLEV
ncbi:hypothetical protein HYG89_05020 [Acinetobacter sp. SwsAc5]|uniref:hypothetical protein n=1 Tax=Acinetobacter sp. SwsAc5 TaxID=2749438 RepID=UPI0015C0F74B|nr:hypothetical protein [Acinetobacter sp. SwsAc5]NWK51928.1 hypothetical protein [Acinetobacter sp. SwsAc5]